jgi:hypothetical protein
MSGGGGQYTSAAVCRRGHVEAQALERRAAVPPRCPQCGAEVLIACPACGSRIRGEYDVPGVIALGASYEPPRFCDHCGAPFPWLDRAGRIYELQNLLDSAELDPAAELTAREQLEALADPDLDDEEATRRWDRVRKAAPTLWKSDAAREILVTLISGEAKKRLGLP